MNATEYLTEHRAALADARVVYGSHEKAASDSICAVISSRSVDRMGDVVEPRGGNFDHFMRNPVVLWGHNYSEPSVGKVSRVWSDDVAVRAQIQWAPTERGRELASLYQSGFLSAFSIGFKPTEVKPIRRDGQVTGAHFIRWELLELSAVSVPANAEAVVEGRSMPREYVMKHLYPHDRAVDHYSSSAGLHRARLAAVLGEVQTESLFDGRTTVTRWTDGNGESRYYIDHR